MNNNYDINRKEDFFLPNSEIIIDNNEIVSAHIKVFLPEKTHEKPYLLILLDNVTEGLTCKIANSREVKLNTTSLFPDNTLNKTVSANPIRFVKSWSNYQKTDLYHVCMLFIPENLQIVNHGNISDKNRLNLTFWISGNSLLSPTVSQEPITGDGNVIVKKGDHHQWVLPSGLSLTFDEYYKYKESDNGETRQWSHLIAKACIPSTSYDFDSVLRPILEEIDDYLLIVSFASRTRTVCLGWEGYDNNTSVEYYRGGCVFPIPSQTNQNYRNGIVDTPAYDSFINSCYTKFNTLTDKEPIRAALHSLVTTPSIVTENSFLNYFSNLETLILAFRRDNDVEYILPKKSFKILRDKLEDYLKEVDVPDLDSTKAKFIRNKLGELNRVSLNEAFQQFCKAYEVNLSDLWPVFGKSTEISLSDIRNKLIHGDNMPFELLQPLGVAEINLKYVLERIVVKMLGYNVNKTRVSATSLKILDENIISTHLEKERMNRYYNK